MFFSIDTSNGVAIYEQIVRQVKFAVAEGTLRPGQRLPSVRTLASQLAINPNTINRAFQQLQGDGTLQSLRGVGLAVAAGATEPCQQARRELITERLRGVLSEALHAGLTAKQVEAIVAEQLARLPDEVATIAAANQPTETGPSTPPPAKP